MTTPTLSRAVPLIERTGRTIEGIAYAYAHPSLVHDDNPLDPYYEQILRGADRKTIRDRAARGGHFPLLTWHAWTGMRGHMPPEQIGDVEFHPTDDHLEFKAVFRHNRTADEVLDMVADVDDPVASDVSATFKALRTIPGVHDGRTLLSRAEIAIVELSVAPTGTGQHDGARILVHRADTLTADTIAREADLDARLRLLDL